MTGNKMVQFRMCLNMGFEKIESFCSKHRRGIFSYSMKECLYLHFQAKWETSIDPFPKSTLVRGAVASWLVRSAPDRAVRVRDLAGDIALCS